MMTSTPIFLPTISNALLAQLPLSELELMTPHLHRVRLVHRQVLIELGQSTAHIFFIESGIVTLLARPDPSKPGVQVAMIGPEGMVGGLALLDGTSAAYASAVVQVAGGALRISLARLRQCLEERTAIREVMFRFVQSLARQAMENAARNANQTLAERCVNWLLMAHERIDGDDLPITHEALSSLLGVRRSGVTLATTALQKRGLIRTSRGRIRVLDREGLMAVARGAHRLPGPRARKANPARETSGVEHR